MKLLIADDNRQITAILEDYGKNEGYLVDIAYDGDETLEKIKVFQPDILLLDVMMPKKDGFEVCRTIRQTSPLPIIMVTARGEDFEKIMGLEIGADDYIVKPFSPKEVMARIKAVMRRFLIVEQQQNPQEEQKECLEIKDLYINLTDYEVKVNGGIVPLTKKEIEILWVLVSNQGKVFSRDNLLDSVWGYDYYGDNRTVDSHIKRLRSKLGKLSSGKWEIKTIWGVGYKFDVVKEGQRSE